MEPLLAGNSPQDALSPESQPPVLDTPCLQPSWVIWASQLKCFISQVRVITLAPSPSVGVVGPLGVCGDIFIETFAALRRWFLMLAGQSCSGDCQICISQELPQRLSRSGSGPGIFCILT